MRKNNLRLSFVFVVLASLALDQASAQTFAPTRSPTLPPSSRPTGLPTSSPTAMPTTLAPTTATPTRRPTNPPTFRVTAPPTTVAPTAGPTSRPSTAEPTTRRPTMVPTTAPTQSPIIGTRSPVEATASPTVTPTIKPTVLPTAAPTLALTDIDYKALMRLTAMQGALQDGQLIDWEETTAAHIRETFKNMQLPLKELQIKTDVQVQNVLKMGDSRRSLRKLQDAKPPEHVLEIIFTVFVKFRAEKNTYNVKSMVLEAFNTDAERSRYIQRLQNGASANVFEYLQAVHVEVDGQAAPSDSLGGVPTEEENNVMLYVIAAAGGGCALVVVGLVFLYCTRKAGGRRAPSTPTKRKDDMTMAGSDKSPLGMAADILVNKTQDDVSTLGDPVLLAVQPTPDEQTASVGNDYDYSREYRRAHGIPSDTGSLERNESVGSRTANSASFFSSDNSLEQFLEGDPRLVHRFEVTVPPGKLGIVMDNSPGGTPMVFAVKPQSVLSKDVQVGDRLLSVDQEDVTVMSAIQVSKLISLKADQQRTMVFCRKRTSENAQDL